MNTTTAFFYRQPIVLDRELHKNLRLQAADSRFASSNQAVPLVAGEFPEACLEYPIVFHQGDDDQWLALALTGLKTNTNAFVDAKGRWAARYVPASVRQYPFILAESGQDQLSLAIDMAAPHLGKKGEALFDAQGEPTAFVHKLMPMLLDFHSQAKFTHALAQQLDEAGLLTRQNLQVRLNSEQSAVVEGVWVVDETRWHQLGDEKILAWFKNGQLIAVHAHLLSLRNLLPLLERSQRAAAPAEAPTPKKTVRRKAKATPGDAPDQAVQPGAHTL